MMAPGPNRYDGAAKVTGRATYAAEHPVAGLAYAVPVLSTIARGRVLNVDAAATRQTPGVHLVVSVENMPALHPLAGNESGRPGENRFPLSDAYVHHDGQVVAVVVAETLEIAQHAAEQVTVAYASETPVVSVEQGVDRPEPKTFMGLYDLQYRRGDPEEAMSGAPVQVKATYETPIEHHNPIEPHATIAVWREDRLTLFDSTQGVVGTRDVVARLFNMPADHVRVVCPYVGGGFGCKGSIWPRVVLAAAAAKLSGRPVKLVMGRDQMFSSNGHRASTVQPIELGSRADGTLVCTRHEVLTTMSEIGDFIEPSGVLTPMLYACPNVVTRHTGVRLNLPTPTSTRGPGETSGAFALECAMDELAHQLGMDPVALRVLNHAPADPEKNKPWSSKHLLECYELGARRFGWDERKPAPNRMPRGRRVTGFGMASACYPANRRPCSARVSIMADGGVEVVCASQDLGTGTYTVMARTTADVLGLQPEQVAVRLGDTDLPPAPLSGGSSTTASLAPAVRAAAEDARQKLIRRASTSPGSPLHRVPVTEIDLKNGSLFHIGRPRTACSLSEVVALSGGRPIIGEASLSPAGTDAAAPSRAPVIQEGKPIEPYALHSFGAHFVEVEIDTDLGTTRVTRVVSIMDVGRVVSPNTARSQIEGGIIWGIGMALMERTVVDPRTGRLVTRDLAEYLVPTHADMPRIEVNFLDRPDPHINAVGARGMGEIGLVGVAPAIANAVFNATGRRVRSLPITPETLL